MWGGYTASNVTAWYWWRFNGFGYFWGMVTGIGSSLVLAALQLPALNWFPAILLLSLVGCVLGTLLTAPEDEEVLKSFYRRVRPWAGARSLRRSGRKIRRLNRTGISGATCSISWSESAGRQASSHTGIHRHPQIQRCADCLGYRCGDFPYSEIHLVRQLGPA